MYMNFEQMTPYFKQSFIVIENMNICLCVKKLFKQMSANIIKN